MYDIELTVPLPSSFEQTPRDSPGSLAKTLVQSTMGVSTTKGSDLAPHPNRSMRQSTQRAFSAGFVFLLRIPIIIGYSRRKSRVLPLLPLLRPVFTPSFRDIDKAGDVHNSLVPLTTYRLSQEGHHHSTPNSPSMKRPLWQSAVS